MQILWSSNLTTWSGGGFCEPGFITHLRTNYFSDKKLFN